MKGKASLFTLLAFLLFAAPPARAFDRKFDEYGNVNWENERARLDNFAAALQSDPEALGYLICYGGRVARAGEARRRCARAKGYISGYRRVEPSRVVTVDGGYREGLTVEVWVVPPGAAPPVPTPHVDPREVRFVKPKPKRKVRGS